VPALFCKVRSDSTSSSFALSSPACRFYTENIRARLCRPRGLDSVSPFTLVNGLQEPLTVSTWLPPSDSNEPWLQQCRAGRSRPWHCRSCSDQLESGQCSEVYAKRAELVEADLGVAAHARCAPLLRLHAICFVLTSCT
jgi:hypothetical protein